MHLKVKCIPFLYCSFLPWHTSLIAQPEQPPHEHECLPFFLFLKWKKITRANSTAIIAATIIVGQSIFILLLLIFYFIFLFPSLLFLKSINIINTRTTSAATVPTVKSDVTKNVPS